MPGLGTALFLIFLTLKLTGFIDWSWFWVASPLLAEVVVVIVAFFGFSWFTRRHFK